MSKIKHGDNKTLRTSHTSNSFVVLVNLGEGLIKYISKDYNHRHAFLHTVVLGKAKRFNKINLAHDFIDVNEIKGEVREIETITRLMEV